MGNVYAPGPKGFTVPANARTKRNIEAQNKYYGESSELPPILDIAGRPLTAPVGSKEAEAQLIQAGKIYQAINKEVIKQPTKDLQEQKRKELMNAIQQKSSLVVQQIEPDTTRIAREEFYLRGKQTGQIDYPIGREAEARTITPSRFTFQRGGEIRVVQFSREGAQEEISYIPESNVPELNMPSVSYEGIQPKETKGNIFTDVGNFFGSRVSSIKERIITSKDPVVIGYRNMFGMGKEIVTPAYRTVTNAGRIVNEELVIPTIENSRMMLRDIASPTKLHLETVYGKPKDMSVTRWISTAVPKKLGEGTANFFTKAGMKESKVDISMLKDIVQPVITTAGYFIDITKDVYRYNRTKEIKQTVLPSVPSTVNVSPQVYGKGVEYTLRVGQYFVPYYGSSLIFGSATESALGGALGGERTVKSYIKEHPVEATFTGIYGGVKAYPFLSGYLRTSGRTEIPVNIVPEKVVSGKQTFWSEGKGSIKEIAKTHLSLFKSRQYGTPIVTRLEGYTGIGKLLKTSAYSKLPIDVPITPYHATGSIFWKDGKFVVGESPLHVAPGLSANFLRIGSEGRSAGFWNSLTSPFMRSGALTTLTSGKNIIIRKGYESTRGTYLWKGATPPAGKLVIPAGGKTEVQGLFLTGTSGNLISQKYYGVWKGVRYPIDIFKVGGKASSTTTNVVGLNSRGSLSYRGLPSTSASVYRGVGLSSLYKPSTVSVSSIKEIKSPSVIKSTTTYSFIKSSPSKSYSGISSRGGSSSKVSPSSSVSSTSSNITPSTFSSVGSSTPSKSSSNYSSILRNYSSRGSSSSIRKIPDIPKVPKSYYPIKYNSKQPSRFGKLSLLIKQKGIWKSQGKFSDINKATATGKFLTGSTINRSFKIEGGVGKLPTGYRYQIKKGKPIKNVFVELSKTAISQKGEREALLSGRYYKGGRMK